MTTKQYLNSLRVFQYMFTTGMLCTAGGVGILLKKMEAIPLLADDLLHTPINIICIAFGVSMSLSAIYVFNTLLSKLDETKPLLVKLEDFKKAYILRGAMFEGFGVVAVASFFLTSSMLSIYVFTGSLVLLIVFQPSKKEIKKSLRLNLEDSLKIDQDSSVLTNPNDLYFKNRMN